MLLLFSLGQHDALKAVQTSLRPSERLFAHLHRVQAKPRMLCGTTRIQVHVGKTACDRLEQNARFVTQEARV